MEAITVSAMELEVLLRLLRRCNYDRFSCNSSHEVWPSGKPTLSAHEDRIYLGGRFDLLDGIVELVLEIDPAGKQFYLRENHAEICETGQRIADIQTHDDIDSTWAGCPSILLRLLVTLPTLSDKP